MYVHPILGEDQGLIRVLEGKLAKLTQRVPTLQIEHIPAIMHEFVVGVPPIWIHLLRWVARAVCGGCSTYLDMPKEARVQGERGN